MHFVNTFLLTPLSCVKFDEMGHIELMGSLDVIDEKWLGTSDGRKKKKKHTHRLLQAVNSILQSEQNVGVNDGNEAASEMRLKLH